MSTSSKCVALPNLFLLLNQVFRSNFIVWGYREVLFSLDGFLHIQRVQMCSLYPKITISSDVSLYEDNYVLDYLNLDVFRDMILLHNLYFVSLRSG